MAGLARVLLQFRHGAIAAAPLRGPVNPAIAIEGTRFVLPERLLPWNAHPRRAGLSSFGAGGVNVHLVLEEPPPVPLGAGPGDGPELVPLSARTAPQLSALAGTLAAALGESDATLAEVAHTLQTGREALAHRAAFLVADLAELRAALERFARGEVGAAWTGIAAEAAPQGIDERALLRSEGWAALAPLWVAGMPVAWAHLRTGPSPRRVALPGYPFSRERHWPANLAAGTAPVAAPSLHPLLAQVLPSLHGAAFAVRLEPAMPLVAGHRVEGVPLLPGAAIPEMVRAATVLATGREEPAAVADLAWLARLAAPAEAVLTLAEQGGDLRFELASGTGEGRTLHRRGWCPVAPEPPPPPRDTAAIAAGLPGRLEGAEIYARLARLGVTFEGGSGALPRSR